MPINGSKYSGPDDDATLTKRAGSETIIDTRMQGDIHPDATRDPHIIQESIMALFRDLLAAGYSEGVASLCIQIYVPARNAGDSDATARTKVNYYLQWRQYGCSHEDALVQLVTQYDEQAHIMVASVDADASDVIPMNTEESQAREAIAQSLDIDPARIGTALDPSKSPVEQPSHVVASVRDEASTVLELGVERGDIFWKKYIAEQSVGCYLALKKEKYSDDLAREGAIFYCQRLPVFTLAEQAMRETRVYCKQRQAKIALNQAVQVALGKQPEADSNAALVDPAITSSLREYRGKRLLMAAILAGTVVVAAGAVATQCALSSPSTVETTNDGGQ